MTEPTPNGSDGPRRSRRRVLAGVASLAALAGCRSPGLDAGDGAHGTATRPSATAPSTPGDTGTPTVTPDHPIPPVEDPPTAGPLPGRLEPVDAAMRSFVARWRVPAATVAVERDGFVLERAYGWADADRSEPLSPDALFRTASLTKSLTAAAVRTLDLDPGRRVLPLLDVEPADGFGDDRLREVTVDHLLTHAGGWDASTSGDPMFRYFEVANDLGLSRPPTTREIARWTLGRSLQFTPGERHAYANVGYALLGLLIEAETGRSFPAYVRETLFDGPPPDPVIEGASLPADRDPREPDYVSYRTCPNAAAPNLFRSVPCADGGIVVPSLGGAGELVTSARTLATFHAEYPADGFATDEDPDHAAAFGSLPGTFGMVKRRPDGVTLAVLFNSRGPTVEGFGSIQRVLDDAVDAVEEWPVGDG